MRALDPAVTAARQLDYFAYFLLREGKPVLVIEMQGYLAVAFGAEPIPLPSQPLSYRLVTIELAVHDRVQIAARVAEWLCAVGEPDDAQSDMAERGLAVL